MILKIKNSLEVVMTRGQFTSIKRTREVKEKIKKEVLKFIELVKDKRLNKDFPSHWKID